MALGGNCRSGFGGGKNCDSTLLPLEVAQLHVFFTPFLLGEEGAEWVEFGFGWVALASNVHLIVAAVDEVWSDRCGQPVRAGRWGHKAEADVALQRVAVSAAGGRTGELAITVDGLAPPGPQVQFGVMVLQNQHDESAEYTILTLLQQGLVTEEIGVLVNTGDKRQERK